MNVNDYKEYVWKIDNDRTVFIKVSGKWKKLGTPDGNKVLPTKDPTTGVFNFQLRIEGEMYILDEKMLSMADSSSYLVDIVAELQENTQARAGTILSM